jgi:hypothetical protein
LFTAAIEHARALWGARAHPRTPLYVIVAGVAALAFGLTTLPSASARTADAPPVEHVRVDLDHQLSSLPGIGRTGWTAAGPPVSLTALIPAPAAKPIVPIGKGMWLYQYSHVMGGDAAAIVRQARAAGLTHVYMRLGSTVDGFYAQSDLDRFLPVAHAAGIKVVGWDFPELHNPDADAARGAQEVAYRTPSGDHIDAFSADIETPSEGTDSTPTHSLFYGARLRGLVGQAFPLIAAVPRPSPYRVYPYYEATAYFDAIAPMVYWINRDPVSDVLGAIDALAGFGKPIIPVGQAYDPSLDGQAYPNPTAGDLTRFMNAALSRGVAGLSFWSWDAASYDQWSAVGSFHGLDLATIGTGSQSSGKVAAIQRALKNAGRAVPVDGRFGAATHDAIAAFQRSTGLTPTGQADVSTIAALTKP